MAPLVMVIEDEEALGLLLKYNLEKEGYEVILETRGNKALAEIEKYGPSVILLDWMLPEISGVEICKLVRSKPDIKNIPIIMLTAKGEEEDKIKGPDRRRRRLTFTKPFSVPELMARVKTNLRRAPEITPTKELVFEDIRMDLVEKKVFRGENYIHLGPTVIPAAENVAGNAGQGFFPRDSAQNRVGRQYLCRITDG